MKLRPQELALMLPGLGLLAFGLALKPAPRSSPPPDVPSPAKAAEKPRAYVSIQRPLTSRKPGAECTTMIRAGLHFTSRPSRSASARWYYNCRITGTLRNRPHVFYASGAGEEGTDRYNCVLSSALTSSTMLSSTLQHVFLLRRLPVEASSLVYSVKAVALEGAAALLQEVTRRELEQALRSTRRLGYAINSIPLSTPGPFIYQPFKYLQASS